MGLSRDELIPPKSHANSSKDRNYQVLRWVYPGTSSSRPKAMQAAARKPPQGPRSNFGIGGGGVGAPLVPQYRGGNTRHFFTLIFLYLYKYWGKGGACPLPPPPPPPLLHGPCTRFCNEFIPWHVHPTQKPYK